MVITGHFLRSIFTSYIILCLFCVLPMKSSLAILTSLRNHNRCSRMILGRQFSYKFSSSQQVVLRRLHTNNNICIHRFLHFSKSPSLTHSRNNGRILHSSSQHQEQTMDPEQSERRIEALHNQLEKLGIDSKEFSIAVHNSLTTLDGYDIRYGKSAIKTYRTYVDPKPSKVEFHRNQDDLHIAAVRVSRQIDFLIKRHRSHITEWVRHTDNVEVNTQREVFPLILLLDNVRSAFNVGSLFRTADACGCCMVITTGITPHPNGNGAEKLAKSALGADHAVPSRHFATTLEAIQYLRSHRPSLHLVGMETTHKSKLYTDVIYAGEGLTLKPDGTIPDIGTVLVLGNEVTGVDTEILDLMDNVVEIKMFGLKNSLNIAACAPVVLYEILRQWNK